MGKLFKYLKTYWKMAFVILLVLLVQVYCDLSLPSYTSDIVNVGIQQAGVDVSRGGKIDGYPDKAHL